MNSFKKPLALAVSVMLFFTLLAPANTSAITIAEEEELSREFLKVVLNRFDLIRDPYIVQYVNSIGQRILEKMPSQPFNYRFYVVNADVYNAFATPAGHIFIYSGLIAAMESEDELAGIIGHEIAHVQCRHISQKIDRSTKLNLASLAGVAAGIFLGAGGAAGAANAVTVGSVAAAQSIALAYSREDELQADQIGLNNLKKAGYDGGALLKTLEKLRERRWFGPDQIPTYVTTHPATEDRIAHIDSWLESNPAPDGKKNPRAFQKAHTRLMALYIDETRAKRHFKSALDRNPEDTMAHYGMGLLLARMGLRKDAVGYLQTALENNPLDPYLLKDLGRIYFLDGRLSEAMSALKGAIGLSDKDPESLFYLGRTQMVLGNYQDAANSFEKLLVSHSDYHQTHYFLGETYGKMGKLGDAHYHLGLHYEMKNDTKNAIFHLEKALQASNDPDRQDKLKKKLAVLRKEHDELQREERMKEKLNFDRNGKNAW